jgi:D-alanyl-D-alanine carboxypeptidase
MVFIRVLRVPGNIIRWFLLLIFASIVGDASAKKSHTDQLHAILNYNIAHSVTPGAVLLVSSPELGTITVAAGLADKKNNIPMEVTNNFRIASMSKMFLAVTVLKLIEQKKLSLNDKIADLLPNTIAIGRIPNGTSVTVQQLLQMRSGIPNYTDLESYFELIDNMIGKEWTPEICVAVIYGSKAHFAPGADYEYSNTNYLLLQLIIEQIEGGSYADAIRANILEPLKLTHTFIETQESDDDHYLSTKGYTLDENELIDVTKYNDGWGMGDGGIISTAEDLNLFINALFNEKKVLPPVLQNKFLSFRDDYGLGIWREDINEETTWTHNGLSSGFQGQFYYFPDHQLTIIILTNNYDTDIISNVVSETHKVVTGLE